jgi:hypothetical protein
MYVHLFIYGRRREREEEFEAREREKEFEARERQRKEKNKMTQILVQNDRPKQQQIIKSATNPLKGQSLQRFLNWIINGEIGAGKVQL